MQPPEAQIVHQNYENTEEPYELSFRVYEGGSAAIAITDKEGDIVDLHDEADPIFREPSIDSSRMIRVIGYDAQGEKLIRFIAPDVVLSVSTLNGKHKRRVEQRSDDAPLFDQPLTIGKAWNDFVKVESVATEWNRGVSPDDFKEASETNSPFTTAKEFIRDSAKAKGNSVLKAVINSVEQYTVPSQLPQTFAEAHMMSGHAIEDVIGDDLDIDAALKSFGPSTESDQLFAKKQNLKERSEKITEFTKKFMSLFPDKFKKGAYNIQSPWMQHNSRARIKAEVGGSIEKPTSRIYLNPELEDSFYIYDKIFKEAESQGLRFSSKVFGYMGEGDKKDKLVAYFEKETEKKVKLDPIVFYGYPESQDALLQIVEKVYKEHEDVFIDRSLGGTPMQIAPGFGLGMEPTGLSGSESLTSHREDVFYGVQSLLSREPGWDAASAGDRKQRFTSYIRAHASELNIDPDNIAFEPR